MISINKILIKTLVQVNQFSYYIHLKDHNKKINPQKSKLSLSYMNPKILKQDAPREQNYLFDLRKKTQKEVERKMFEEYKEKVLKGQIDVQQQVQIDPLWGQEEKPRHYFQMLSKTELMAVSSPQNQQFMTSLQNMQVEYFKSSLTKTPNIDQIKNMSPKELVNAALFGKNNQVDSLEFWHNIQKAFGNRFYDLNMDQLIKLNFCLKGLKNRGTPRINQIVRDLIEEDLNNLSKQQLIAAFYSYRYAKTQGWQIQQKIVETLTKYYNQMTFNQKVDWLFMYTLARKPQAFKQRHQKVLFQQVRKGHQLIFNLNFDDNLSNQLTIDSCIKLIYSLAKLRANNTRFITDEIVTFLKENISQITQDLQASYKILFYSQQIEGGVGIYDEQVFSSLVSTLTDPDNFATLSKIQQIRTLYAIWNYNKLDDNMFQLYQNLQIQADSSILYYFVQIQLSRSSERQWEILKCIAQLQRVPLPYFQAYKRFYNYMKVTTDWDLTPIQQKLRNTEYYFDVLRGLEKFYNIPVYRDLQKYFKFSAQISPFQHSIPIQNVEVVQFSYARYQISIDVVDQTAFVPGTNQLKESYRNKIRNLSNLGWKHVVLRERQLSQLKASDQIKQILYSYEPYVEQQLEVLQNRDYYRAEQVESIRIQDYWDGMIAEEAEGYRNDPEQYARKVAELAQRQKKLSQEIAKVE